MNETKTGTGKTPELEPERLQNRNRKEIGTGTGKKPEPELERHRGTGNREPGTATGIRNREPGYDERNPEIGNRPKTNKLSLKIPLPLCLSPGAGG